MAARDKERYFWLKLHRNFFKRHDVCILEKLPDGKELVLLYLKLLTESVDHEGALRFSDELPYTEEMLAVVTDTQTEFLHSALKTLQQLRLLEVREDGTLFLPAVGKMVGSETYAAKRKREAANEDGGNFPPPGGNFAPEKETESETEKKQETNTESNTEPYTNKESNKELHPYSEEDDIAAPDGAVCRTEDVRRVIRAWNSLGVQKVTRVSSRSTRGKMLRARIGEYGIEAVLEAVERIRTSTFLKGQNETGWMITFDWFVKPNNFPKVLEGNYEPYTPAAQPVTKNGFLELMMETEP